MLAQVNTSSEQGTGQDVAASPDITESTGSLPPTTEQERQLLCSDADVFGGAPTALVEPTNSSSVSIGLQQQLEKALETLVQSGEIIGHNVEHFPDGAREIFLTANSMEELQEALNSLIEQGLVPPGSSGPVYNLTNGSTPFDLPMMLRLEIPPGANSPQLEAPQPLSREEMIAMGPEALVDRAVAYLGCSQLLRSPEIQIIRDEMRMVLELSDDPYLRSIAETLQYVPATRLISNQPFLVRYENSAELVRKALDGTVPQMVEGATYPEAVRGLFDQLAQLERSIVESGSRHPENDLPPAWRRAEVHIDHYPGQANLSMHIDRLLKQCERDGVDPAVVERANQELAGILTGVRAEVDKLQEELGRDLSPLEVVRATTAYLHNNYQFTYSEGCSIAEGLASHQLDCDLATHIYLEVGKFLDVPIGSAVYQLNGVVLDPNLPNSLHMCIVAENCDGIPHFVEVSFDDRQIRAFGQLAPEAPATDTDAIHYHRGIMPLQSREALATGQILIFGAHQSNQIVAATVREARARQ